MKTYKMKVEKKETSFVDLQLPYYCRDKKHKFSYYKIFSEDEYKGAIKVSDKEIQVVSPDLPFNVYGQEGLEEINEKDFTKKLEKTYSALKKL